MKKLLFLLLIVLIGCQKDQFTGFNNGTFTDFRDRHEYKWVRIGQQIWMAENLAYLPSVSPSSSSSATSPVVYVYGYIGTKVNEARTNLYYHPYGALYNWVAAQTACPRGWHLPTDEEWKILEKFLGMSASDADSVDWRHSGAVGGKLKESGYDHWNRPNAGVDNSSGFTAIPGGCRPYTGGPNEALTQCVWLGYLAYFWTASARNEYAWAHSLYCDETGISRFWRSRNEGETVRCIKDN